jgi:hypothetical protein
MICPSSLTKEQRVLFNEIVTSHRHLKAGDAPMVVSFVEARLITARLAKGKNIADWEKAARVMASLATKLRLTPQSSVDPHALSRKREQQMPRANVYDTGLPDDDDDE